MFSAAPRARDRVELDGREPAAGLPEPKPNPDRAVAVSRPDLERTCRAPRYDHDPQKAAVLLGDGHLVLVGGFDLLQHLEDVRQARRPVRAAAVRHAP